MVGSTANVAGWPAKIVGDGRREHHEQWKSSIEN
jgi:hypothetical protein